MSPPGRLDPQTLELLEQQHPSISQSLFTACGANVDRISTLIEPILSAPHRCAVSTHFIQAITTGSMAFLTTNLWDTKHTQATAVGTSWLMGRNSACAIALPSASISRCHAVIGYVFDRGFYIMDLGSKNGTYVNRRRLYSQEQRFLSDGDLIDVSRLCIEFFVSAPGTLTTVVESTVA